MPKHEILISNNESSYSNDYLYFDIKFHEILMKFEKLKKSFVFSDMIHPLSAFQEIKMIILVYNE